MSIIVTFTATKPEGTVFFQDSTPENIAAIEAHKAQVQQLPGFISLDVVEVDQNTRVQTLVFDTVENYANYVQIQSTSSSVHDRTEYNHAHGITVVMTETIT